MPVVFSEPPVDVTYERLPEGADAVLSVPFIRNILRSDYRYFYRLDKSDL